MFLQRLNRKLSNFKIINLFYIQHEISDSDLLTGKGLSVFLRPITSSEPNCFLSTCGWVCHMDLWSSLLSLTFILAFSSSVILIRLVQSTLTDSWQILGSLQTITTHTPSKSTMGINLNLKIFVFSLILIELEGLWNCVFWSKNFSFVSAVKYSQWGLLRNYYGLKRNLGHQGIKLTKSLNII